PLTRQVDESLDALVARVGSDPLQQVEQQGRRAVAGMLRTELETYRGRWHRQIGAALDHQREVEEEMLARGFRQVAVATEHHLGVRLTASMPSLTVTGLPELGYDIGAEQGWDQAAYSMVRRVGPGALRRTSRYLHEEAQRLVDKHVGRARSELQRSLDDTGRHMHRALADAFADLTSSLTSAARRADEMRERSSDEVGPELQRLRARRDRITELTGQLRYCVAS
ncbi:MAG: hypothetical protein ACRDTP_04750, partial [Mycobacteriales bacterium]